MAETVAKEREAMQVLDEIEEKLFIKGIRALDIPEANLTIMLSILDRLIELERAVDIGSTYPYIRPGA